jgi:hypothetical protein
LEGKTGEAARDLLKLSNAGKRGIAQSKDKGRPEGGLNFP